MKQRTEFTYEEEETIVLRRGEMIRQGFCPVCCEPTVMAAPQILAALAGSTEREIFRLIEAGKIHFIERPRTFACLICYGKSARLITGASVFNNVQVLYETADGDENQLEM
jgi:hypothetical protein